MYRFSPLSEQMKGAKEAQTKEVVRYGVTVYVETDSDWVGPDFFIDPADEKGLAIFRKFAADMAAHYKSLTP